MEVQTPNVVSTDTIRNALLPPGGVKVLGPYSTFSASSSVGVLRHLMIASHRKKSWLPNLPFPNISGATVILVAFGWGQNYCLKVLYLPGCHFCRAYFHQRLFFPYAHCILGLLVSSAPVWDIKNRKKNQGLDIRFYLGS